MQPTVLGSGRRYRTSKVLSEDRLGTLWAGSDAWTGGSVTVRILHERLASDPPRLQQVSGRLRRLQWASPSPHLARMLDHDLRRLGGRPAFAVFEGSGEALEARLERDGALDARPALEVIAAVADGLAAAHAARVFHGALTAANVLVHDDGLVVVIDVGLGELLAERDDRRRPGRGEPAERGSADVFAVAALFEWLLSGAAGPTPPVEGEGPRPWEPEVPADIGSALRLASSPHRRLRPSMTELAAALASDRTTALDRPEAPDRPEPAPDRARPVPPAERAEPSTERSEPAEGAELSRPPPIGPLRAAPPRVVTPPPRRAPAAPPRRPWNKRLIVLASAAAMSAVAVAGVFVLRDGDPAADAPARTPVASPSASASPTDTFVPATVPAVLGLTLGEATVRLESAGLVVGSVGMEPGEAGIVVRSDPTQGEAVVAGTEVDLFVGDGEGG
jgi:serine/threonine-protein kinase